MRFTPLIAGIIASLALSTAAQARDQISIVGSSTVYPFSTIAAEKFGQTSGFKTPVIESTGTGGGMKLFCKGIGVEYPDVTNASRAIKSKEAKMCADAGVAFQEFIVGNDGIAFSNSLRASISRFQLRMSRPHWQLNCHFRPMAHQMQPRTS